MARKAIVSTIVVGFCAALFVAGPASANSQDRVSDVEKGSLIIFPKVEVRWDNTGKVIQDTFLDLTNDYPGNVTVQMYFVNGDPPTPPVPGERAHLGWNWVDVTIDLTGNEPTYWSALSGLPKGVSPWTVLDPGSPQGRPDPDGTTDRVLRGYVLAWAVDPVTGYEIRWNHLKGDAVIIHYEDGSAWEYNAYAFQALRGSNGAPTDPNTPGALYLNGVEYDYCFSQLLLDFYAVGSTALSRVSPFRLVTVNTDLTIFPVDVDLRQETDGPVTTKAKFDIWNMNEVKFSNTERCISCWDQALLSRYDAPNHFLLGNLQTDKGKARIDGIASQECDVDYDPDDQLPLGDDPRDIVSVDAALLGVAMKLLTFDSVAADVARAGMNLVGMGTESALVQYDYAGGGPPESPPPPPPPRGFGGPSVFGDDTDTEDVQE